jgi:hypothetical protein
VGDPVLDPGWVLSLQLEGEGGASFLACSGRALGMFTNVALALCWVMFAMALGDSHNDGEMLAGHFPWDKGAGVFAELPFVEGGFGRGLNFISVVSKCFNGAAPFKGVKKCKSLKGIYART